MIPGWLPIKAVRDGKYEFKVQTVRVAADVARRVLVIADDGADSCGPFILASLSPERACALAEEIRRLGERLQTEGKP